VLRLWWRHNHCTAPTASEQAAATAAAATAAAAAAAAARCTAVPAALAEPRRRAL